MRYGLIGGVVAGVAMAAAGLAHAGGTYGVSASGSTVIPSGPNGSNSNSAQTGPVSAFVRSDDIIGLNTWSIASATAEMGTLRSYGFSNGGVTGLVQNAAGIATWFDQIYIDTPGTVLVTYTFQFDGYLEQSLPGPFSPQSVGLLQCFTDGVGRFTNEVQGVGSRFVNRTATFGPFAVTGQQATPVLFRLTAYVNGRGTADFSSTAQYTGCITTDELGNEITPTITADSGFDYRNIPAPGAAGLAAVWGLLATRRRRA